MNQQEIGRAIQAIETIARLDKPICEIASRCDDQDDIEHDLIMCLDQSGYTGQVFYWILPLPNSRKRLVYGFYKYEWARHALEFMMGTEVSVFHRTWINGLLFGYTSESIQAFIDQHNLQP